MSQSFLTPDRLFDRPWQPGHAFGRKPSRLRRMLMMIVFLTLCAIIGGYLYLTDANRVRSMAQQYLTQLVGGKIEIGSANLSIFEGLRLKDVRISVDTGDNPDSTLFTAQEFRIKYGIRELLAGRIEAAQIVAIDPHVYLTENVDTGQWNYQRLIREPRVATRPTSGMETIVLPEIMLRNARVDYAEVHDGRRVRVASMAIEAHCIPSADGQRFMFELQSHGGDSDSAAALGPTASGSIDRNLRVVSMQVRDIELQRLSSMLPKQVRQFAERHNLRGRVDVPVMVYQPPRDGGDATFRVVMELNGVKLKVQPKEWLSTAELERQRWTIDSLGLFKQAGMNAHGTADYLQGLVEAAPVELDQVSGKFEFTQDGITITGMKARIENNLLNIDGRIKGYSPTAPVEIHVASSPREPIVIPTSPRYVSALPRQVLDIYDQVRPWGKCNLKVSLSRPTGDSRLEVQGTVDIVDGGLCYSKFAYPMRKVHGRVQFGPDPESGMDCVRLINLEGQGVLGGPNQNVIVNVNGIIGPLPGDPAVDVTVVGHDIHNEPALMHAFPPDVRKALRFLDADGKGLLPTFEGDFVCKIRKNLSERKVNLDTMLTLKNGAGKLVAFPYPLEHVTGKLDVVDGAVHIIGAHMKRGKADLYVDGTISWRAGIGRPLEKGEKRGQITPVRPDIHIRAQNVALDKELLAALPSVQRAWLKKVGAQGRFDLKGRVWSLPSSQSPDEQITHEFSVHLRDGSIWPVDGAPVVSKLTGDLRLFPSRMEIRSLMGNHGVGNVAVSGMVAWPNNRPTLALNVSAKDVELDHSLYHVLPQSARSAWNAVHPEGSVDADLVYRGGVAVDNRDAATSPTKQATTGPSTQPAGALGGLDLTIRPRKLAVTLAAAPYRLDDLKGTIHLNDGKVSIEHVQAKHGSATIQIDGTGSATGVNWNLTLAGENVTVDDDLRKALPAALRGVFANLKLGGKLNLNVPKLIITRSKTATRSPAAGTPIDMGFLTKISGKDMSADVGVPLTDCTATIELAGTVRNSRLDSLAGPIDISSGKIANRDLRNVHLEIFKPPSRDGLRIGNLQAQLAGGEIVGQVDIAYPTNRPSHYVMNLVMRGADCRQLTGDKNVAGELNASLALEGDFGNVASRRGRGDVSVSGKNLYKMPLLLGLLQITNLSLPLSSPFNEGSARYNVTGQKVTFESIEVRAKDLLLSGSGQLDFGTKQVNLTFSSDNPGWAKLPLLGDIMTSAKQELFLIHVRGTLKEPRVSASSMNTFTTTVDQVFKSDSK